MFSKEVSQHPSVPGETWEFPVENGYVVVRPDIPCLFCLNPAAKVIWQAYREMGSQESVADLLVEVFGIPHEVAARDVASMLRSWIETGLLGPMQKAASPQWNGRHRAASVVAYCSIEGKTFLLLTDSLEMMAEVAPRLDGIRIEPCTPDVTLAVWGSAEGLFAIVAGDELIAVEQGVGAARAVLFQELVQRARPGREWLALLHAGACGIEGRCVLFPASSYSGKSTLAAALMASGFALYSDDFAGVEAGSLQLPVMPFSLAVRRGSWDVLRSWIPEIDDCIAVKRFGEEVKFLPVFETAEAIPSSAVAIVFSQWVAGENLSVHKLTTADVIGRLNESGFWVPQDRASIGAFLAWLEQMPKFALRYGDLTQAVAEVKVITAPPPVQDCPRSTALDGKDA